MKTPCLLAFLAILFAAALVKPAGAQTPFTTTSPPNSNPFGSQSGGGFGPMQAPRSSAQQPQTQLPSAGGYAAALPAAPVYSSGQIDPDHKLARGDHLSFRVQEDRDDKVWPVVVTDSGEVELPYLNRVKASNKTVDQLRAEVKSALERDYYYHATVIMGLDSVAPESSRGRIFITGAVHIRGALELPIGGTLTVSQAVVQAGGSSDFGNLKRVKVIRKGGPKNGIEVNVKAVQAGEIDKDVVLEPGDTVNVPEKTFNISF